MRIPAPSKERAESEEFRRQECSRLFLAYLGWASDMLDNYHDDSGEMAQKCCEYVEDGMSLINKLVDKHPREVLLGRYVERKTVPELAKEYGVTDRTIHNWCEWGLLALWPNLPENWKYVYVRSTDDEED